MREFDPDFAVDQKNPMNSVDKVQGATTYLTSALDLSLFMYEMNPALMEESDQSFHTGVDEVFESLDQQTSTMSRLLSHPDMPEYRLENSVYLESLKLRSDILYGLDPGESVVLRRKALARIPSRIDKLIAPRTYIVTYLRLGQAFLATKQPNQAIMAWKRALSRARDFGYTQLAIQASRRLAEEYARRGDWEKVALYSASASEGLRDSLGSLKGRELSIQSQLYTDDQAIALLNSNKPEKALQAIEHGRQLTAAAARIASDPRASKAVNRLDNQGKNIRNLRGNVARLERLPPSTTRDSLLQKAETLLADTRAEFLLESRKIRAEFPRLYSSSLKFDPLNLAEIQATLPAGTSVVEYFPTEQTLYIFVVDRKEFRIHSVSLSRAKLDSAVLSYLNKVRQIADEQALARELYGVLIRPIEEDIAGSDQLILIPAGRLNIPSLRSPHGSPAPRSGKEAGRIGPNHRFPQDCWQSGRAVERGRHLRKRHPRPPRWRPRRRTDPDPLPWLQALSRRIGQ
jgi:tetratricopeptide (TPR) repeat protein